MYRVHKKQAYRGNAQRQKTYGKRASRRSLYVLPKNCMYQHSSLYYALSHCLEHLFFCFCRPLIRTVYCQKRVIKNFGFDPFLEQSIRSKLPKISTGKPVHISVLRLPSVETNNMLVFFIFLVILPGKNKENQHIIVLNTLTTVAY